MSSVLRYARKKVHGKRYVTSLASKLLAQSLLVTIVLVFPALAQQIRKLVITLKNSSCQKNLDLRSQNTYQGPIAHYDYFLCNNLEDPTILNFLM